MPAFKSLPMLLLLALHAPLGLADEAPAPTALREQARHLRDNAEARFAAQTPACQARFLVNRCLDEARRERLDAIGKARELEITASRIELAEKQREAAARGAAPTNTSPQAAPSPLPLPPPADDSAAEALREARERQAREAEDTARSARVRADAEKAADRAKAEEAAARRAEKAERDRLRYDERIRKREAELEKEGAPD